jgi:hypothetical protein
MGRFDDDQRTAATHLRPPSAHAVDQQRAGRSSEQRILQLQRQVGNAGVAQLLHEENDADAVQQLVSQGGRPLDASTRAEMESALGHDFGDVRVHTGGDATASAQRLGARAYTVGDDVVFGADGYDPASDAGRRTLAHELTHVVQQRSGPVDGTDTGTGLKVSHPDDRFERAADAAADHVVSGSAGTTKDSGASGPATAQREMAADDELDETAQGLWVQREDEMEEEAPEEA